MRRNVTKQPETNVGMSWEQILNYDKYVVAIATKYTQGSRTLREDVIQETRLRLFEDKRLDLTKFDPKKLDAAIRTVIRNNVFTIIKSKRHGRLQMESVDQMNESGYQIDSDLSVTSPFRHTAVPEDASEIDDLKDTQL
jgi:DNA-directed RNA polymerase specialized sigma24 family protein